MKKQTINTQEKAISFIESLGYKVQPSFKGYVSISKNGNLHNIIKETELIKQALYLKDRNDRRLL